VTPDVVIVLDLPDEIAEARVSAERDRFERAGRGFHGTVRDAYRRLAAERGWALVDASGTPEAVAERVLAAVASHIS
jgi:thymidylate kinase